MKERLDIIALETPQNTEKYYAPPMDNEEPFLITEYGKTFLGTPCYQLRINSKLACLQYVICGSGVIICDDAIYTVNTGDTFLLLEGTNQIYYSNPDNQFERIWINFKGELGEKIVDIYKLRKCVLFRNLNTLDLLTEMQEICKKHTNPVDYKNETARLFLKIAQFLSENKTESKNITSPIEQVRLYIDTHIMENLKLPEISHKFYFSEEHIIRTFKQNYGITPHQYILQSKIRIAMIMLQTSDNSIETISELLNFSDPHHFSSQFNKYTGFRPSNYRKNFRK